MNQQQTLLRRLLTKTAAEVFLSIKQPISTMKKYSQFQKQLINKINHIRDNKKVFEDQAKTLRQKFQDTFELLDKEIEHNLSKLSQKQIKKQLNRSQSLIMPEQRRTRNHTDQKKRVQNVSYKKENLDSKLTEKRYFENQVSNQPQKSLKLLQHKQRKVQNKEDQRVKESQIKTRKNELAHNKLTFLSKQDKKQIQLYCCFICYKNNEKHYMWQRQKQYLDHLKDIHQIVPDFEYFLELFQHQIMLSHAFFKGKLVNLMKNNIKKDLVLTIYLLHKQRYEQLYFCGCKVCRNSKNRKEFSIFSSQQKFYEHVKGHNNQKISDRSSHLITSNDQFESFTRNKKFNFQKVEDLFKQVILTINQYFLEIIDSFSYPKIVHLNPLNHIQIVSCSKKVKQQLSIPNIYSPFPYCTSCDKFEENWSQFINRHSQLNKCIKTGSYDYSLDQIKKFMYKTENYKKFQLPQVHDRNVAKEELQILKAQLSLMRSSDSINKSYKICAECEQVFNSRSLHNYIKHIYLQHPSINPLNNYEFTFLLESPLSEETIQNEV